MLSLSKKVKDMENNKFDAIHPSYYNSSEISCIDAMIASKGLENTIAFCDGCVFKYEWRLGQKDIEEQEVGKMKWYLDKYLELKKRLVNEKNKEEGVAELMKRGLSKRQANEILNK